MGFNEPLKSVDNVSAACKKLAMSFCCSVVRSLSITWLQQLYRASILPFKASNSAFFAFNWSLKPSLVFSDLGIVGVSTWV